MKKLKWISLVLLCFISISAFSCVDDKTEELESGKIYTLQEVCDAKAISYDDLLSIACHSGNREINQIDKNFKPTEINELSSNISLKIRECLVKNEAGKSVDDYQIIHYYGCYNGVHSFVYRNILYSEPTVEVPFTEIINGISFYYVSSYRITMCKI